MAAAKEIHIAPISAASAQGMMRAFHYSKSFCQNSQLHFGVFLDGKCQGAMSFGPSMDKNKIVGLIRDTKWNGFLELNRMAFGPLLPRNSESRALAVAMRIIKKAYPHIEWIISFADGTQCGDGTIYRASGFILTGIRENKTLLRLPDGRIVTDLSLNVGGAKTGQTAGWWKKQGAKPLPGFQLRYLYFLNKEARSRLTVPEIPFSKIAEIGARMYLGKKCAGSREIAASGFQSGEGCENQTPALQQPLSPEN